MFIVFENGFLFYKIRIIKKKKENMLDFQFVFFIHKKNIKTLNLKNEEEFLENTFFVLFVFSKTILKNNIKKQKPNRP